MCVWGGCACMYVYVCFSLVRFSLFGSPLKSLSSCNQTWVKDAIGVPSYGNEIKGHVPGQGSSEVKLGWKCKIDIILLKSWNPITTKCNLSMQHVNLLLNEWVGLVKLGFLSYFYASYYDIEVPCKLLPPCQGIVQIYLYIYLFSLSCSFMNLYQWLSFRSS